MKAYWRLAAAGAITYLLILLVTFPAERAGKLLERSVDGLDLQSVSGTVFSGNAQRLVIKGLGLGPVNWSLRPVTLLLGRLEYHVTLADPAFQGEGIAGMGLGGHVYLDGLKAALLPDPLVNHFSPLPVQSSGGVTLLIESMKIVDGFPREFSGRMDWADAHIIEPVELSLGHVEATLHSEADTLVGRVSGSGDTALTGDFSLTPAGDYRLNLLLTPGPAVSPDIVDGLKTYGQARSGGAYLITDSGRL